MKKIYSLLFVCLSVIAQAQTAVPNGGFELWNSANYEIPANYGRSSNPETFFRRQAPFNCVKTSDAFSGNYALKLTTVLGAANDTVMGYVTNCEPQGGNPCTWKGGIPYNQKPTGFRGHYKSNIVAGDSAGMIIIFKNAGVCLGMYMYKFGGVHSAYTPFSFTFSPALASTPDTVLFATISSDVFNNIQKPGSMIQLDSLAFTGVGSQPALFNGDFETWQTKTLKSPSNWYMNSDDQGNGISQTTDSYTGTYAIQLSTFLGDNNGAPQARGGGVSTGYSDCPQSGPCVYKGGFPFSNKIDTLEFYYKYVPSGNDSAQVSMNFRKNGSSIWNAGTYLLASATYQYMKVPFNMGTSPDTVIVEFQSSSWSHTALSFVGSVLKVDNIRFKSQPLATGIKNYTDEKNISIYPNPSSNGIFQINNVGVTDIINVYNLLGEETDANIKREKDAALVQLPQGSSGIYFIQVNSEGKTITKKVIIQ